MTDAQVPKNISHQDSNTPLNSTDSLLIVFWALLAFLSLLLHNRIRLWWTIIAADIVAAALVWLIAWANRAADSRLLRAIHDWAAFPFVIFTYKQLYYLIGPIHHGKDYDQLLIAADRLLFGVNPTDWLAHFSNPILTEVLQVAYSLFYAIFLAVGLELYRADHARFSFFRFTVVYGFFISYVGYFFLPSIGPRFTLYDFSGIDTELPGLLVTPALRWFVNIWESIPPGISNAVAAASAQRDVFPSGHTMMTLVAIVLAYRYRLKLRNSVLILGILLIVATVYLRYHYVVDVIAGALLIIPCLLTADKAYSLLAGKK